MKLAGKEATILIHLEPQSTSQTHFPQRLFFYFALLHQKHLKPKTIALNLLRKKMDLEMIAEVTGLTISELEGFAAAQRQQLQADNP